MNTCVCCGEEIPEGYMVCQNCESEIKGEQVMKKKKITMEERGDICMITAPYCYLKRIILRVTDRKGASVGKYDLTEMFGLNGEKYKKYEE